MQKEAFSWLIWEDEFGLRIDGLSRSSQAESSATKGLFQATSALCDLLDTSGTGQRNSAEPKQNESVDVLVKPYQIQNTDQQ